MRTSYNWLKEHVAFDMPAHELATRLSHIGLNIETYEPHGDDWMLDVEVKSNRPDCLCHAGIAREIAAVTGGTVELSDPRPESAGAPPMTDAASVVVEDPDLCPRYTARVIRGVKVGPSPQWLQDRLIVCGVRPVNNVVDATNYVMLECSQPLHAFDLSRLEGARVVVRRARAGEALVTIDGSELKLDGTECVIADERRPVALAGVMGGIDSEISDRTTDVLIESARFDPIGVRRTARRHQIRSDSSYRFERGVDPEITDRASRRVCELILELAGGTLLTGGADLREDSPETPEVTLRWARLALLLGIEVPRDDVLRIFRGLGLAVLGADDDGVSVRVPSWRPDLGREVDLIEEVARIHGYDRIGESVRLLAQAVVPDMIEVAERRARRLLAGQGFHEVMTYSLVPDDDLQKAQPWTDEAPLAVRNPTTVERTHLRLTNMANLLRVKRFNTAHGTPRVDLFEMGRCFAPVPGEQLPTERVCLTLLSDRDEGLRVLKGVLSGLLDELCVEGHVTEAPGAAGPFDAEASVLLRLDDDVVGAAGVCSPQVAESLDLQCRPALLELDFSLLAERTNLARRYSPVPAYPATARDLAVVVTEATLWADIERCVRERAPETLESIEVFDVYRGKPVPVGKKSVAFSMTFRCADRTITAAEADEATAAILDGLKAGLGVELRA